MKKIISLLFCVAAIAVASQACDRDEREAAGYTEILTVTGNTPGSKGDEGQNDQDGEDQVKYDIYLLIGQSNMAGRGTLLASDLNESPDGVFLLDSGDKPVPATHPFNQ